MNYRSTDKLTCNMFRKISSLQASVVTNILLNLLSGSSNGRKDTSRHLYPDRPEKEAHVEFIQMPLVIALVLRWPAAILGNGGDLF